MTHPFPTRRASDLAVTAVVGAVRAAPAQAGDAHAGAPAPPRRVRFPRPAAGGLGRACRGHRVLARRAGRSGQRDRSEEHTSELQSLMRISYAVFCFKKKKKTNNYNTITRKS